MNSFQLNMIRRWSSKMVYRIFFHSMLSYPFMTVLQKLFCMDCCCRYSCFYFQTCSLWISFGVYVTGILFQTASFVSFFLISHGYCIMCERLSVPERRTMAALGCVFYLILVGHRASVPYFTVSYQLQTNVEGKNCQS